MKMDKNLSGWTSLRPLGLALGTMMVLGAAPASAPAVETATTAAAGLSLEVDLSERRLYAKLGGEVIESYTVAVGQPKNPSPKGKFSIRHIVWNPRWVPPDADWAKDKKARDPGDPKNPMGRVKLFFQEPDYYIHGTREVDSLGRAESRGCIRMRNAEVIALAKLVMKHGGTPKPQSWFQSVISRVRSTRQVWLSRPVPITIKA